MVTFFPRNVDFFKQFEAQAEQLTQATKLFTELTHQPSAAAGARAMRQVERAADEQTRQIIRTLNQTFITPIDREDIVLLAAGVSKVIDAMERAANRLALYQIAPNTREITHYVRLIDQITVELAKALHELKSAQRDPTHMVKHCEIVSFIENQIDEHHRETLGDLMNTSHEPVEIMKRKEIYDTFERVADRAEAVANILETIAVKYQ